MILTSMSQMGRFETEILTTRKNLEVLDGPSGDVH